MVKKSCSIVVLIAIVAVLSLSSVAQAQVTVVRGGAENPMVTIGKSTLYGAGTGLLIGLALTLVVDGETGDIMKWSFIGGTFGGFAMGLYHVANRPQPSSGALFNFDSGGLAKVKLPEPQLQFSRDRFTRSQSLEMKINLVCFKL